MRCLSRLFKTFSLNLLSGQTIRAFLVPISWREKGPVCIISPAGCKQQRERKEGLCEVYIKPHLLFISLHIPTSPPTVATTCLICCVTIPGVLMSMPKTHRKVDMFAYADVRNKSETHNDIIVCL